MENSGKGFSTKVWKNRCMVCLALSLLFSLFCINAVAKAEERKTIRVGFYQVEGYHELDDDGKRQGYGYEFLQKIGRYLPYTYEYAGYDKNWQDMLVMLENGEIDLLTGGGKTEERERQFGYSEYAIGTNITTLTVREDDDRFEPGNYQTYDGMRIGFVNNSFRAENFKTYAEENGFAYIPVYYDNFEELAKALQNGEIDGIVSSNLMKLEDEVILDQFDYSDFYVMTQKKDTELLDEVNKAIRQLDKDEPGWRTSLLYRFYGQNDQNMLTLTAEESGYLHTVQEDGTVFKVLVNPDRKPYSYFEDGEVKGIIPTIFACAADRLGISYEVLVTENREEYYQKLISGEADICMDMGFDYTEAENSGYKLTDPYMGTGFSRITRKNYAGEVKTVSSIKRSFLMSDYLEKRYDTQNIKYYDSVKECVDAVENGDVDAAFLYTYSVQQIMNEDIRNRFDSVNASGEYVSFAMGVSQECDPRLITALNKTVQNIRNTEVEGIILDTAENLQVPQGLTRFLYSNPVYAMILMAILGTTVLVVVVSVFRLRSRKKLRMAYEEVKAANNAKRDFMSKMSHDIKTPMNAIMGMTEIIERHAEDERMVRDYLGKLRISENYLLTLLDEILDMSRIDSGKMKLENKPFSLECMTDEIQVILQEMTGRKEQELKTDISGIRHRLVIGDKRRIEQILINLLTNASKFTQKNGIILLQIKETGDGKFVFCVKDNGIGIAEDQKEHIFDAFSRVEDSRISREQGTGLGLSIARSYVDMIGGTIDVESAPGRGTEFVVCIPLELQSGQEVPAEEKDEAEDAETEQTELDGLCVLLVEDNEINREIAQELLESMGVQVDCAENGKEAVERFASSEPGTYDVILMDLQMPVMDGLEASRQIRKSDRPDRDIPIFALSANAHEEDIRNSREAGMNEHISKPFDVNKVYALLRDIRGRK